jgi:hypothetical protein
MTVLVVDYEQNGKHEWRPRVERFGGDLEKVYIWQPDRAVWDIAHDVRQAIASLDVDYVVVDSVTYACVGEEVEKSATATRYSLAIAQFDAPVLSLAHTSKADEDAKYPFGSTFWHNGARVTVGVTMKGAYNEPRVVSCRKFNQGAPFRPYEVAWDWVDGDMPATLSLSAHEKTVDERVMDAVESVASAAFAGLDDIWKEVVSDGGHKVSKQTVSNSLQRLKNGRTVEKDSTGRQWKKGRGAT